VASSFGIWRIKKKLKIGLEKINHFDKVCFDSISTENFPQKFEPGGLAAGLFTRAMADCVFAKSQKTVKST
jgi:hypothetical protein